MLAATIRRKTGSLRDVTRVAFDEEDDRPIYLKEFPRVSSALKDVTLGVLLGRQAICDILAIYAPAHKQNLQDLEGTKSGLHGRGHCFRCSQRGFVA
jgi:hypothetical protein